MKSIIIILALVSSAVFGYWDEVYDLDGNWVIGLGDFTMLASRWLEAPPGEYYIDWVYINDPGVPNHEGFAGRMSKYEITNAQYCLYLKTAFATGDVIVSGNYVVGADGANSGLDFTRNYYQFNGLGYTQDGATNGGKSRISFSDGSFIVESGFEDHPVTYVCWYGAVAFCNYYGWRLPTEWEWQAVADYRGSFLFATGTTISNSMANYAGTAHLDGTTPVGLYGVYGHGVADMAGNVWEWTSSVPYGDETYRVARGGAWNLSYLYSQVGNGYSYMPDNMISNVGFRVCR